MDKRRATVIVAAVLLGLWPALSGGAAELDRPTVYGDAWGGYFLAAPSADESPEESGYAAGAAVGSYFDLGRRVGGALRLAYWEAWEPAGAFARRYTTVDALLGPRWGPFQLLAGLSVVDRRDWWGEQWGGWGWRVGVTGEKVFRRVVAGAGLYATPSLTLRRWSGGTQLDPAKAAALEEEVFLVVPLGRVWAVRAGYRGFQLGVEESGGWLLENGEGFLLGLTARF